MPHRIRIGRKLFFAVFLILIGIRVPGNSLTVADTDDRSPIMLMYELRLTDIKLEQLEAFGINGFDSTESGADVSLLSNNLIEFNLPGMNISASAGESNGSFRYDFRPKIMTAPGKPASVSITRQIIGDLEAVFTTENLIFSFNPVSYNPGTGFVTEVGLSKSGDSGLYLMTTVQHRERDWLPIAIIELTGGIERSSLLTSGKDELKRYAVVYMRGEAISSWFSEETLSEEDELPFVWMDLDGLDTFFPDSTGVVNGRPSFISGDIELGESLSDYLIGLEGQLYFPDIFFVNPGITVDSTYSLLEFETAVGFLIYDSFAAVADFNYNPIMPAEERFSVGLGFDDITNPMNDLFMEAGFVPVRIYPGREGEGSIEFPLEWYLSIFSDTDNGWNFGFDLTGNRGLDSFSAEIGYRFSRIEVTGGIAFNFGTGSLSPYFRIAVIF